MMSSLYSGVSGLQNHEIRMNVIGNNISNINTIGFKKGRVTFQDIFSQYLDGPSKPNEILGGVNPKQVGLGMSVASIDTIFHGGSLQTTGVKSDLAITGNGFFVLKRGDETFYTRAGSFDVDSEGMLVNPADGTKVQGWSAKNVDGRTVVNATGAVSDLHIPLQGKDPALATARVQLRSNLNKNTPLILTNNADDIAKGTWVVEQDIFDAFGNTHLLQMSFRRNPDTPNQWEVTMDIDSTEDLPDPTLAVNGTPLAGAGNTFIVNFDNNGLLQSVSDANGVVLDDAGGLNVNVTFDVPNANPDPVPDDVGVRVPQTQTFALDIGDVGSYTDSVTQFASASSTKSYFQDGYGMGYLTDFTIDQLGNIVGSFTNKQRRVLGKIALASFPNPEGLLKVGDTSFIDTTNSGFANIGEANTLDRGAIHAGTLEMSNVDLAEEFTDMIVTQRGFQANSRTIRTSDQMIQELLTLKQ